MKFLSLSTLAAVCLLTHTPALLAEDTCDVNVPKKVKVLD